MPNVKINRITSIIIPYQAIKDLKKNDCIIGNIYYDKLMFESEKKYACNEYIDFYILSFDTGYKTSEKLYLESLRETGKIPENEKTIFTELYEINN